MPIKHVLRLPVLRPIQQRLKIRIRQDADAALRRSQEYLGAAEAECNLVSLHVLLMRRQGR